MFRRTSAVRPHGARSRITFRGVVAILAVAAFVTAAFACGNEYAESTATNGDGGAPDDGGGDSGADAETDAAPTEDSEAPDVSPRDADPSVKCAPSNCNGTCCLARDAATPPSCCGESTAGWEIVLHCAQEKNCPTAQICCLRNAGPTTIAQCASPSDCLGAAGKRLCDLETVPSECARCVSAPDLGVELPSTYGVCQ